MVLLISFVFKKRLFYKSWPKFCRLAIIAFLNNLDFVSWSWNSAIVIFIPGHTQLDKINFVGASRFPDFF